MPTTVVADTAGIAGLDAHSRFTFTTYIRESGEAENRIITSKRFTYAPSNQGQLSVDLDPGPATLTIHSTRNRASQQFTFTVPDADTDVPLWPLIESSAQIPPSTPTTVITEAVNAYLRDNLDTSIDLIDGGAP